MKLFRKPASLAILFCLMTMTANAQLVGTKDFFRLPYSCDLKLFYAIRIPIPENWGIQVPFLNEYDATLTIQTDIDYNFYTSDTLKSPVNFLFALPGETTPSLELRITGFAEEETETTLKSPSGNWERTDTTSEVKDESYQKLFGEKLYTFRILAKDEPTKEKCRDLIRSCKSYYSYSDASYTDAYMAYHHTIYYAANDTTWYPSLGFGFILNGDAEANLYAENYTISPDSAFVTVALDTDSAYYSDYDLSAVKTPDFDLKYSFVQSREAVEWAIEELNSGNESALRAFNYAIAGVPATVYMTSSKVAPTLLVDIPLNGYNAMLTFRNVTKESQPKIVQFLSQIYIDDARKDGLTPAQLPAESFETLTGIKSMYDEKLTFNKKTPKNFKTISCVFPESQITVPVPMLDEQASSIGEKITPDQKQIVFPDTAGEDYYYSAYTSQDATSFYLVLYKTQSSQDLLSQYTSLVEMGSMNIDQSGYTVINGRKWMTMTTSAYDAYTSIYFTEVSPGVVLAAIVYSNSTDMSKTIEALVHKASFAK